MSINSSCDDALRIQGGTPLRGSVRISGAKNATLPMMAAAILSDAKSELVGVPAVGDVAAIVDALAVLGMRVERDANRMTINTVDLQPCELDSELAGRTRASICLLGPLLARRGRAVIALPGGCQLGPRPVDLHLRGLEALGARMKIDKHRVIATAKRLRGATIDLHGPHGPTVTGTANILSAAVLADGTTTIQGAAREPEIVDLGEMLTAMGAQIAGLGTSTITIEGVARLDRPVVHRVMPDRIEASTYAIAALATGGEITLPGARADHLVAVLEVLRRFGAEVHVSVEQIALRASHLASHFPSEPIKIIASPYPGLPTDVQPLLAAMLAVHSRSSYILDDVFPNRFAYAGQLRKFGANIIDDAQHGIQIHETQTLHGANVIAQDLRGGAALVVAALAAQGESIIQGRRHIDRGYEHLVEKLRLLGADISAFAHNEQSDALISAA